MATIESIDCEQGWQYLGCKTCNKKVLPTGHFGADGKLCYKCDKCGTDDAVYVPRFKLIATVKDDTAEANFLLFDSTAQLIVGHSAAELYDEELDPEMLPEPVSDLLGKRILFKISIDADNLKNKNTQFLVRLPNDNREMIEEFAALPPKQESSMLGFGEDFSEGNSSATPLSKRKSEADQEEDVGDQLSVSKSVSNKKVKSE